MINMVLWLHYNDSRIIFPKTRIKLKNISELFEENTETRFLELREINRQSLV